MKVIYIVIPVLNRWMYTQACLLSLQTQSYDNFKIIVVDHGSTDGTTSNINDQFPQVIVLSGDINMWWASASNLGVTYALNQSTDYVLTLNNDLVVDYDYLHELICTSNKFPNSIVGSVSVDINDKQKIAFAGIRWNRVTAKYTPFSSFFKTLTELQLEHIVIGTDLLPGRGTLIPSAVFNDVGLFDDNKFPHYMADEDLTHRAKQKGYKLFVSANAVVYSHLSATGLNNSNLSLSKTLRLKQSLTSIKSPNNLSVRWHWSHNATIPLIYFLFDLVRVLYSQTLKILKS